LCGLNKQKLVDLATSLSDPTQLNCLVWIEDYALQSEKAMSVQKLHCHATKYSTLQAFTYKFLLITTARRSNHISPTLGLRELHWRPTRERVKFKVACLVRQSLSGQEPLYLADDCRLVSDSTRRSLRSADVSTCVVPRTLSSYGDGTFAAAGPRLWNSLPVHRCVIPTSPTGCSDDS